MTRALPHDAERRLFDYAHAAVYLSVSIRTMKQLAAEGEIRKVSLGHRRLFDKADLDEYIERIKRSAS